MRSFLLMTRLLLLLLTTSAFAQLTLLENDREGDSYFIKKRQTKDIQALIDKVTPESLNTIFHSTQVELKHESKCPLPLFNELIKKGRYKGVLKNEDKTFLKALRSENLIDDIVLNPLLKINQNNKFAKTPRYITEKSFKEDDRKKVTDALRSLKADIGRKSVCDSTALKKLILKFFNGKKVKKAKLRKIIEAAFTMKAITFDQYENLDLLRRAKVQDWKVTIEDYISTKRVLRTQYPLPLGPEYSNLVTEKFGKKQTRRESLYKKYNYIQIITMGNVIKDLRADFDSSKMEIVVYNHEGIETRRDELDPMERFRYAIKRLRKRMVDLQTNFLFESAPPNYFDIIVSAYEIGIITAEELDEVALIEQIWNPKKNFWDKYGVWIKTLGGVAAIVIPPPFGFIPMLGIVIIEATTKKEPQSEFDHSIFGL